MVLKRRNILIAVTLLCAISLSLLAPTMSAYAENENGEPLALTRANGDVVTVAVIDTGYAGNDASVEIETVLADDDGVDNHGHGTAIIGEVRAQAPDARIVSIKAFGETGTGTPEDATSAIDRAVELGADVINMSFSGKKADGAGTLEAAIGRANDAGVTLVASAGNDNANAAHYVPASYEDVVTVGAMQLGARSPYSNYGRVVDAYVEATSTSVASARLAGWLAAHAGAAVGDAIDAGFAARLSASELIPDEDANWEQADEPLLQVNDYKAVKRYGSFTLVLDGIGSTTVNIDAGAGSGNKDETYYSSSRTLTVSLSNNTGHFAVLETSQTTKNYWYDASGGTNSNPQGEYVFFKIPFAVLMPAGHHGSGFASSKGGDPSNRLFSTPRHFESLAEAAYGHTEQRTGEATWSYGGEKLHWAGEWNGWNATWRQVNIGMHIGSCGMMEASDGKFYNYSGTIYHAPNPFTVYYDGNGATGGWTDATAASYDGAWMNWNGYTRAYNVNYDTHGGWISDGSANPSVATFGFNHWENSGNWYNPGGTYGAISTGYDLTMYAAWDPGGVTLANAARTGYSFTGWHHYSQTGDWAGWNGDYVVPYNDWTVHASWNANTYTVAYNGNGNTGGSTASSSHTYDTAKNLTANGFTRAYTVTYNHNYSGSSNTSATATYSFNGWNTASNGTGTNYSNQQSVVNLTATNGATVNLYAKWTSASVTLETPTRTGYLFGGWYKEAACTNKVGDAGASYTPTAGITLYAKWTPITYTVAYNANGGSGTVASQTCTYDVAFNLRANAYTRVGWKFVNWNTKADGTGTAYSASQSVKNLTATNNATVTLYAQWKSLMYAPDSATRKVDAERYAKDASTSAQGDAMLVGATFQLSLYPEVEGTVMTTPYAQAEFKSTTAGLVPFASAIPSKGSWALRWDDKNQLCQGTLVVKEVAASTGYQLSSAVKTYRIDRYDNGSVTIKNTGTDKNEACPLIFEESVIRGTAGVSLTDADYKAKVAHADATLANSTYQVINKSDQPVMVGGALYNKGAVVATLTTDADGNASCSAGALPYASYELKETAAPTGYTDAKHDTTFTIRTQGQSSTLSFEDAVQRGGVTITLADADTRRQEPQGDATLAGAVFRIVNKSASAAYVDGASRAKDAACKTITTNASGVASTGAGSLPYGTYEITQITAPTGYLLTDTTTRSFAVRSNGAVSSFSGSDGAFDAVQRGTAGVSLTDKDYAAKVYHGDATLANSTYEVVNRSPKSVVVDDVEYAYDEVVATITTDGRGNASTSARALPYGSYYLREMSAPTGYLNAGHATSFAIRSDKQASTFPFVDTMQRGGVTISISDADTRRQEPQGDATLAGATFEIVNMSESFAYADGTSRDVEAVCKTITTDESGVASTAADLLPYGTYEVRQVTATAGYLLPREASKTFAIRSDGQMASFMGANGIFDPVQRGTAGVSLTDKDYAAKVRHGDGMLANSVYEIVNESPESVVVDGAEYASGDVVATITTDMSGNASTSMRALPYGSYLLRETAAPTGYKNAHHEASFSVRADAQAHTFPFVDAIIRGGVTVTISDADLRAIASQGDATLAGAVFAITNRSVSSVYVDDASHAVSHVCKTITTNTDGVASTDPDSLPYGTYELTMVTPPRGYQLTDPTPRPFEIREDGEIVPFDPASGEMSGDPASGPSISSNRGSITGYKVDAESGGAAQGGVSVEGAQLTARLVSAAPVVVGGTTYTSGQDVMNVRTDANGKYVFGELPYATYTIRETEAPAGYELNTDWSETVSVREQARDVQVPSALEETASRGALSIAVVDADTARPMPQGDATLAGAVIEIVSDNDEVIMVDGMPVGKGEVATRIQTNAAGVATTEGSALPNGKYKLHIAQASEGYSALPDVVSVEIRGSGTATLAPQPLREKTVATPLTVHKIDSITRSSGVPGKMKDCQFGLYLSRDSAHGVTVNGIEYAPGSRVDGVVTGDDGRATTHYGIPYGSYYWKEEVPPAGYNISDAEYPVYVRQDANGNAVERLP